MNNKVFYLLVGFTCMAALTSCTDDSHDDQNSDNPLVGLWEEAVNYSNWNDPKYFGHCEGSDLTIGGTWLFELDGTYRWEFSFGTIAGADSVYSSGTYALISDSILVLDSREYDKASFTYWDTLHVMITDTLFTSMPVISMTPFRSGGCKLFWNRIL